MNDIDNNLVDGNVSKLLNKKSKREVSFFGRQQDKKNIRKVKNNNSHVQEMGLKFSKDSEELVDMRKQLG